MVLDPLRTNPLYKAIHKVVKRGDVVCDIGAGLGLLTFYALSAGARCVYAIDCDKDSLNVAIEFAKKHGVVDNISFIEGHSSDVYIGEKADVVICETIGSAAFDENILATLKDAKKRFLRRGGKIIPAVIELWGAPATFKIPSPLWGEACPESFDFAQDKLRRRGRGEGIIETAIIKRKNLLCSPTLLAGINTQKKFRSGIHVRHNFIIKKNGKLSGVALWPKVEWSKDLITDASPLKPPTHWKQCILPNDVKPVRVGEKIHLELIIEPDPTDLKKQTEILWKLNVV